MIQKKEKSIKLSCFSPEVMLITFLIEGFLAIYIYFKKHSDTFSKLTILMLAMLALFQIAEFQICGGTSPMFWTKIGFVAITTLPALGLHLISLITKKTKYLKLGYIAMIVFIVTFVFVPNSISNYYCGGNYIIFRNQDALSFPYGLYYFGFLLLGVWEAIEYLREKNKSKALEWIVAGYASFMVPMGVVYAVSPATRAAVPSIMCGFAVVLALILTLKVIPEYYKENSKKPKKRKLK